MATAMTDNTHSSGSTTPSHFLPVPSTTNHNRGLLPFPTSPSLPDRRTRLARVNVSMATTSYDDNDDDQDNQYWNTGSYSTRENKKTFSEDKTGVGRKGKSRGSTSSWSMEKEMINKEKTLRFMGVKENVEEEQNFNSKVAGQSLNEKNEQSPIHGLNSFRSQRRNIMTPRNVLSLPTEKWKKNEESREEYKPRKESKDMDKQRRLQEADEEDEQHGTDGRLRLPSIGLSRSSPPLHEDFFLTSIAGYEELTLRNRRPSTTSKESSGEKEMSHDTPSSRDNSDVTTPLHCTPNKTTASDNIKSSSSDTEHEVETCSSDIAPEQPRDQDIREKEPTQQTKSSPSPFISRIPVPLTSSRDLVPKTSRDTTGLQRVYLEGLDYMRGHVTNVEEEINRINREFHKIHTSSGEDRLYYLKECNERLLQANSELRKHDVQLEVIDSATRLVRLLNGIRGLKPPVNKDLVGFLTHFWDDSKSTTEQLKTLLIKFDTTVLQRLSNNYITSHSADLKVPICQQYALDIEDFLKDLGQQLTEANILVKSYESSIHQNLLDTTEISDELMLMCDLRAFPILGFVQGMCVKISLMCQKARQWLARDEQFMHEINTFIKETRSVARRREIVLQNEKEKHKRREKNVRIAQSMLHNNRERLGMIEKELKELEEKFNDSKETQKQKTEQIHQKETMVDFLKLTLQQTKRNYSLQSKRSKLLRQVHELEVYLGSMEHELEQVQDKILAKSHEKILLKEKVHTSEQSYDALKTGLGKFSDNLEKLEADVTSLSGQLLQLEIVHTIRTSPETLDNLIDRPSTVKLSQSLKERIRERKRKAALKSS